MNFIDEDKLPVEIKDNKLPAEDNKKYNMFYDYKVRTNGGFVDAIFLSAVMITCIMWGLLIISMIR